jgi:hypothetical protein
VPSGDGPVGGAYGEQLLEVRLGIGSLDTLDLASRPIGPSDPGHPSLGARVPSDADASSQRIHAELRRSQRAKGYAQDGYVEVDPLVAFPPDAL